MISDKMENNEGVTNYKAIITGLVNISESSIRVLYLRFYREQCTEMLPLMCNLVIFHDKTVRLLVVLLSRTLL